MLNPVCRHHESGVRQIFTRRDFYYLCPACLQKVISNILHHADIAAQDIIYNLIEEVIGDDQEPTSTQVLTAKI